MVKEYKNWKYIQQTPASGQVYHHIKRRTILVIYHDSIRLYKDIPEFKDENAMMYPCHAETLIERRITSY